MIMIYIIQQRIVRIIYNGWNSESYVNLFAHYRFVTNEGKASDRDFGEQLKELLLPSIRQEHKRPITIIRL